MLERSVHFLSISSDAAIVVLTERGSIWVLHEYQTRKMSSRDVYDVQKIVVVGGHLDPRVLSRSPPSKMSSSLAEESGFKLVEKGGHDLKVSKAAESV